MPENKQRYSLISVEVASDDEEVIRVDAAGIHYGGSSNSVGAYEHDVSCSDTDEIHNYDDGEEGSDGSELGSETESFESKQATNADDERDEVDSSLGDFDQPVPFVGMQRVIIAVLIVFLLVFIVSFVCKFN